MPIYAEKNMRTLLKYAKNVATREMCGTLAYWRKTGTPMNIFIRQ